jgi:hypothetical protein
MSTHGQTDGHGEANRRCSRLWKRAAKIRVAETFTVVPGTRCLGDSFSAARGRCVQSVSSLVEQIKQCDSSVKNSVH